MHKSNPKQFDQKKLLIIAISIIAVVLIVTLTFNQKKENNLDTSNLTTIRIGWQTPWATQGQLAQVLKHRPALQNNGLIAEFKGFDSGAPLNEAALARGVDVLFTADQPAATLISQSDDWVIIGRLMYNRVSLYVPPNSSIQTVVDLNGKTVAMPFGAAAQRMALKAEKEAGLDPINDVKNINLGIYEQSDLVRDPNATKWGEIDAMAGFDPTPAIFEEKGLVRNIQVGKVVSLIVMSKKYIEAHPQAPSQFLKSFKEAYDYYRMNVTQANQWFTEEAKLNITPGALQISADIEPNLKVSDASEIRLSFTDDDYRIMQEAADFLYTNKMVSNQVNMRDHINLSYLPQ